MAQTLSRIGKYELRAVVARTASSIVYDGWDSDINRRVAVKAVPLSALGDNRETLVRFQRGVRAAGQLSHPNIVNIYDYGETTSDAYIVMEFVDGPALQQMLDRGHHFDLKSITRIVSEVLSALQYSYGRGVVHRDIKPANIMLTPERSAKITDFGIARLGDADITQAGMLIGTPAYMAPEQFTGERIDGRTDVYSTGVMLYHLLTGSLPFEGSLATIMHKVLNVPAPKASARSAVATPVLDHIVSRAMAKRPEDRFQSAAEFRAALQGALAFEDLTLRRTPASRLDAGRRAKTTGSRSMLVPAAMAAGVFLAGAATFGLVWHLGRTIVPPRPPVLAEAAQVAPPAVLPPPVPAPVATPLPPAPQPAPAPEPAAAIPAPDPAPVAKDQASTGLAEPAPALVLPAPANIAASVAPPPPPAETIQAPPAIVPRPLPVEGPPRPSPAGPRRAPPPTIAEAGRSGPDIQGTRPRQEAMLRDPASMPQLDRGPSDNSFKDAMNRLRAAVPPAVSQAPPEAEPAPDYPVSSSSPQLGLFAQTVTSETARRMGLSSTRGLLILGVTAGGAAANAGIRFHDVLLKVNGSELRDLSKLQAGPRAGGTVPVEVFRDGAIKVVQMKVGP